MYEKRGGWDEVTPFQTCFPGAERERDTSPTSTTMGGGRGGGLGLQGDRATREGLVKGLAEM